MPGFNCISITGDDIWISGSPGIVYSSKDGGNTWNTYDQDFFQNGLMQGICAINSQTIYVAGGVGEMQAMTGFIARTFDGGNNWETVELPEGYNRNEWIGVSSAGPENIVIYGGKSHYSFSMDGGASWTNDSVDIGGGGGKADLNSLKMLDPLTWWSAMDLDHIIKTLDGGASWTDQGSAGPGNMFLMGIDYVNDQMALVVGQSAGWPLEGKILRTTDGGGQWNLKYDVNTQLYKVSYIKY